MQMNSRTPHFSMEELRAICGAAEDMKEKELRAAARALFPERTEELRTLYCFSGGGRAFRSSAGSCEKPRWTVQSWPNELAVMADGTLLPY